MTEAGTFHRELDARIAQHRLLDHPFYVAWREGSLTREMLGAYAAAYYPHVEAFPRYLSTVHAGCEDAEARRAVLRNLWDEEGGDVTHPDLWLRFASALGCSAADVRGAAVLAETREAVAAFPDLARRGTVEGLAALYAYESQIPDVSAEKARGLRELYGLTSEDATAYFDLHATMDLEHRAEELALLTRLCDTPDRRERALKAAEAGAKAALRILDGVWRRACAGLHDAAA